MLHLYEGKTSQVREIKYILTSPHWKNALPLVLRRHSFATLKIRLILRTSILRMNEVVQPNSRTKLLSLIRRIGFLRNEMTTSTRIKKNKTETCFRLNPREKNLVSKNLLARPSVLSQAKWIEN